jgi:hypothetical protein
MNRGLSKVGLILTCAFSMVVPVRAATLVQTQMQAVHDLAAGTFGYAVTEPGKPDLSQLTSGSPNQKLLARIWYYGWALRHGVQSEIDDARYWLNDILDKQEAWGHYSLNAAGDEILTTSHFQMYSAGMAGAYLFALTQRGNMGFGAPLPSPDSQILTKVRRWWLDEKKLWDALANGSNQIDAPGARFTEPPLTNLDYRNTVYGQLRNIRPSIPNGWSTDKLWTGGWILEEMYARGHNPTNLAAPLSGYTAQIRIHDTLCIYRLGSEWLYFFPKLQAASDPIFWVQNRVGQLHNPPVAFGVPVNPPVKPANFPGAILTPYPGLASGAVSCPAANVIN